MRFAFLLLIFVIEGQADIRSYHREGQASAGKNPYGTNVHGFISQNKEVLTENKYDDGKAPEKSLNNSMDDAALKSATQSFVESENKKRHRVERSKKASNASNSALEDTTPYAMVSEIFLEKEKMDKDLIKYSSLVQGADAVYKDPAQALGGKITQQKKEVTQKRKEMCYTPNHFEATVKRKYHYKAPERKFQNTSLTLNYPEYLKKIGAQNDEMRYLPVNTKNYQVNIERFRKYVCPHFDPIDAIKKERHNICCNRIKNFQLVRVVDDTRVPMPEVGLKPVRYILINYQHDTHQSDKSDYEGWETVNEVVEELVKRHNCQIKERRCLDRKPRNFDELKVEKECWEDEIVYECSTLVTDTCEELKKKKCTLIESTCSEEDKDNAGLCLKFKHVYECTETLKEESLSIEGEVPFCLDGNCTPLSSHKDSDFNEALSQLNILKEMNAKQSGNPPHVFAGEPPSGLRCKVNILDFKDCCQSGKGWGKALGLAKCSPEEKKLAKLKHQNQCHYIGSFCAEKEEISGFCIATKHSYCCFANRLQREIQVQGSRQIGKGFGSAEHPNCRGFEVTELKKINFDKINLKPLFEELVSSKVRGRDLNAAMNKSHQQHFAMTTKEIEDKFKAQSHKIREIKDDSTL